jgi:hypothetical protein
MASRRLSKIGANRGNSIVVFKVATRLSLRDNLALNKKIITPKLRKITLQSDSVGLHNGKNY